MLVRRLTALEKYEEFLQRIGADSATNSIEALNTVRVAAMYLCVVTTTNSQKGIVCTGVRGRRLVRQIGGEGAVTFE